MTRGDLLDLLGETFQSGASLGRKLGLSRVAVYKQVMKLRREGYPVEVRRGRGYRLAPGTPSPGLLAGRLRGSYGRAYRYLGRVDSTQDELRRWAESGAPEGAVVVAEEQTAGRGRRGRSWTSPPGAGLYVSLLLRSRLASADLLRLSLAAGVAVVETTGVGGLKWPNDVLAPDGRKLAGVLVEAQFRGEESEAVYLGVGINVHASALPPEAAYLEEFSAGRRRVDVLVQLLDRLEFWCPKVADAAAVCEAWRRRSCMLGRTVCVVTPAQMLEGVAEDVEEDGRLRLRDAEGRIHRLGAGEVSLGFQGTGRESRPA